MTEEKNDAGETKKVWVTGKTFEIKDTLRAAGFQWDRARKRWWRDVPLEELEQAKSAVEVLGARVHVEGADDAPAEAAETGGGGEKKGRGRGGNAPSGPRITVGGKTYPVKSEIKELGFTWDGASKQWWRTATKEEAEELRPQLERISPELQIGWVDEPAAS